MKLQDWIAEKKSNLITKKSNLITKISAPSNSYDIVIITKQLLLLEELNCLLEKGFIEL